MSIKKLLPGLVLFFCLILIFNLTRELLRVSKSGQRIRQAQEKVDLLKLENWQLQREKEFRNSDEFLEKEIRDKLMMGKQEELTIVLPGEVVEKIASNEAEHSHPIKLAVWQQWLEVFGVKI